MFMTSDQIIYGTLTRTEQKARRIIKNYEQAGS